MHLLNLGRLPRAASALGCGFIFRPTILKCADIDKNDSTFLGVRRFRDVIRAFNYVADEDYRDNDIQKRRSTVGILDRGARRFPLHSVVICCTVGGGESNANCVVAPGVYGCCRPMPFHTKKHICCDFRVYAQWA